MADRYGATTLPLPADANGQPIGDPCIYYLGNFLQAVVNAHVGAAWTALVPSNAEGPVRTVFFEDPNANPIEDNALPALFIWRGDVEKYVQKTSNTRVASGPIFCLWVAEPAQDETTRFQEPFWQALFKTIDRAINLGHDPSWIVEGDTYFQPQRRGSCLAHFAKYRKLWPRKSKKVPVARHPIEGEAKPTPLVGWLLDLYVEDSLIPDVTTRGAPNKGLVATITTNSQTNPTPLGPAPSFGIETE